MRKKSFVGPRNKLPVWTLTLACLLSLTWIAGCGGNPNLADVKGVVTLDGKPLPDAFLMFVPESSGATSFGKTDAAGTYHLMFSESQKGAFIGSNRVVIRTRDVKSDNSGSIPELVPTAYNDETTLVADVQAGKNTFDFDLKSDASEIEQVEGDFRDDTSN